MTKVTTKLEWWQQRKDTASVESKTTWHSIRDVHSKPTCLNVKKGTRTVKLQDCEFKMFDVTMQDILQSCHTDGYSKQHCIVKGGSVVISHETSAQIIIIIIILKHFHRHRKLAQSAAYWRNMHNHVDRTHSLTQTP